jgi:hypothetical protein
MMLLPKSEIKRNIKEKCVTNAIKMYCELLAHMLNTVNKYTQALSFLTYKTKDVI